MSALDSAAPVLGNPLNHGRAIPLTYEQFRYAFDNGWREVANTALAPVQRFVSA